MGILFRFKYFLPPVEGGGCRRGGSGSGSGRRRGRVVRVRVARAAPPPRALARAARAAPLARRAAAPAASASTATSTADAHLARRGRLTAPLYARRATVCPRPIVLFLKIFIL